MDNRDAQISSTVQNYQINMMNIIYVANPLWPIPDTLNSDLAHTCFAHELDILNLSKQLK